MTLTYANYGEYGDSGCIDIACGTDEVLLYLARNGIEIDGSDISEEMVKVAIKKSKELNLDLNIWASDMSDLKSESKYSLAIIARSGFMHVLTSEMQRKAPKSIGNRLVPGGILTFNTFAPYPIFQAEQMKNSHLAYEYRLEYIN